MTKVCGTCGREYKTKHSKRRFCSLECRPQSQRHESPSYRAAHKRVVRARGNARDHACVDCGGQARDWSQIHGTDGHSVTDYEPRCKPCHAAYDGTAIGEAHGSAQLDEARVLAIRASTLPSRELARIHGVSDATVDDIRSYRTWRHVA